MAEDLKRLIAARGQCKGFMTRLKAYIRDLEPDSDDREAIEAIESAYFEMSAFLNSKITPIQEPIAVQPSAPSAQLSTSYQRLPRIEISKFSGQRSELPRSKRSAKLKLAGGEAA